MPPHRPGPPDRLSSVEPLVGAPVPPAVVGPPAPPPGPVTPTANFALTWGEQQPVENEDCASAYGMTPTGLLAKAGALSEGFTAVHATHLSDGDFALLGGEECGVCLCPTTERDLADGVGQARRLAEANARLSLGTDSHAMIDLFEEARAVELDERLAGGVRRGHSAAELLRAATEGGSAGIGWPEAGRITPGGLADLVTVGRATVAGAGTRCSRV